MVPTGASSPTPLQGVWPAVDAAWPTEIYQHHCCVPSRRPRCCKQERPRGAARRGGQHSHHATKALLSWQRLCALHKCIFDYFPACLGRGYGITHGMACVMQPAWAAAARVGAWHGITHGMAACLGRRRRHLAIPPRLARHLPWPHCLYVYSAGWYVATPTGVVMRKS